ncbi:MAG TPA: hypothetical protein VM577_07085 [Anaerovoracaceae bacterium]|nr:hypothetical protein [Anaerovoracaceae bacterium]
MNHNEYFQAVSSYFAQLKQHGIIECFVVRNGVTYIMFEDSMAMFFGYEMPTHASQMTHQFYIDSLKSLSYIEASIKYGNDIERKHNQINSFDENFPANHALASKIEKYVLEQSVATSEQQSNKENKI